MVCVEGGQVTKKTKTMQLNRVGWVDEETIHYAVVTMTLFKLPCLGMSDSCALLAYRCHINVYILEEAQDYR